MIEVEPHGVNSERVIGDEVVDMCIALQTVFGRCVKVGGNLFVSESLHEKELTDRILIADISSQCCLWHHLFQQVEVDVVALDLLLCCLCYPCEVINDSKEILRTAEVEVHVAGGQ